jgi:PKD repeat protein
MVSVGSKRHAPAILRRLPVAMLLAIAIGGGAAAQENAAAPQGTAMATPMPREPGIPLFVSLHAVPAYGAAPLTVGFVVSVSDPENAEIVSYHWTFGDGNVSTLSPLSCYNTYRNPGSYVVTLTVVTADGRSASALTGVQVKAPTAH